MVSCYSSKESKPAKVSPPISLLYILCDDVPYFCPATSHSQPHFLISFASSLFTPLHSMITGHVRLVAVSTFRAPWSPSENEVPFFNSLAFHTVVFPLETVSSF